MAQWQRGARTGGAVGRPPCSGWQQRIPFPEGRRPHSGRFARASPAPTTSTCVWAQHSTVKNGPRGLLLGDKLVHGGVRVCVCACVRVRVRPHRLSVPMQQAPLQKTAGEHCRPAWQPHLSTPAHQMTQMNTREHVGTRPRHQHPGRVCRARHAPGCRSAQRRGYKRPGCLLRLRLRCGQGTAWWWVARLVVISS